MNKETVVKEVIEILSTSNYIDTSEDLYDGLKQINREITLNTINDFLWALESSTVIDMDGKVSECSEKIKSLLEYMNNERYKEIIDEVYENYLGGGHIKWLKPREYDTPMGKINVPTLYSKEELIDKCKTDSEFSKKWELNIEERELTLQERKNLYDKSYYTKDIFPTDENGWNSMFDDNNIPTKLITLTYNNEKTEIYE